MLGVNLWGVINGIRSFVPLLVQQDAGHIVNTASVAGLVAGPFMGPYNASKHAVVALSETLLHELAIAAPHVHVSVLCPGWVNTRIGESDRNRPDRLPGSSAGTARRRAGLVAAAGRARPGHGRRRRSPSRCVGRRPGRALLDPDPRPGGGELGRRGEPPGPVAHRPDRIRPSAYPCDVGPVNPVSDPIPRTISWRAGKVRVLDQRALPARVRYIDCATVAQLCDAIASLAIRGAPALGAAGAYGVALAAHTMRTARQVRVAAERIAATRPTAVNLRRGVDEALAAYERERRGRRARDGGTHRRRRHRAQPAHRFARRQHRAA